MDRQQLQKIEQACFLASMTMQLTNIIRSRDEEDFSDCPEELVSEYDDIAERCEKLMDDIQKYVRSLFNGEGEG